MVVVAGSLVVSGHAITLRIGVFAATGVSAAGKPATWHSDRGKHSNGRCRVGAVPAGSRLTITTIGDDPREAAIAAAAAANHLDLPGPVRVSDIAFVEGELDDDQRDALAGFLVDPLLQTATWDHPSADDNAVEIAFHPGVTDVAADAIVQAAAELHVPVTAAATGRRVEFPPGCDEATVDALLRRVIANPVIERWAAHDIEPVFHPGVGRRPAGRRSCRSGPSTAPASPPSTPNDRWPSIPRSSSAIREHFFGLGRDPTDVELETLAQTWSEHCAHKTFRAAITVDGAEITPLLRQLRDTTERIDAKFVRSAFVGNAGIVSFAEGETLALKAETHNHPSAVEPFGGANTGVGGVIRDVLGAGHRPIAVTDVLVLRTRRPRARVAPRRRPAPAAHPPRRRRRGRRLRQQDRPADGRRSRALRPRVHHQPARLLRLHRQRRRS